MTPNEEYRRLVVVLLAIVAFGAIGIAAYLVQQSIPHLS